MYPSRIRRLLASLVACILVQTTRAAVIEIPASHASIRWEGRVSGPDSGARDASLSATRAVVRFQGTGLSAWIASGRTWWNVSVDGKPSTVLPGRQPSGWSQLATNLPEGIHEVVISKRTEPFVALARIASFQIRGASPAILPPSPENPFGIEFIGNSITCGYGIHSPNPDDGFQDSTEDADSTASAITARALGAQYRVFCYSGYGVLRDLRNGPGTIPPLYDRTHPDLDSAWDHSRWHPRIIVINLGTNDFATGPPDSADFFDAYATFIRHLVSLHPGVAIALLNGPMLVDGYPFDSLGNPYQGRTILRRHLGRLLEILRPELGISMDTIQLTLQNPEIGWGGDYHPNPAQSAINGQELTAGLRRSFPALLASVGTPRRPADNIPESWTGVGAWTLTIRDARGRLRTEIRGSGPGSLADFARPKGLSFVELVQDGIVVRWRILTP